MTCKDCKNFSNYQGGTCLSDMWETSADKDSSSCVGFDLKTEESEYSPHIVEEYSEYDRNFDEPLLW